MKKIVAILLTLGIYSLLYSQASTTGTSTYRIEIKGHVGFSGSTCGDNIYGGLQWIAVRMQNGTYVSIIYGSKQYPNNGVGLRNVDFSDYYDFNKYNKVISVYYGTTRRSRGTWGCRGTSYETTIHDINICDKISYDFSELNQPGNSEEAIFPVVQLNQPSPQNSYLTDDELLTISLTDNIDNQYYNWQYSFDGYSWTNLPAQFQKRNILSIKGSDFLSETDFGRTVFMRVNMGYCAGSERTSNIIAFTYYKSAPHITGQGVTVQPKCFDTQDGSVTLTLDRSPLAGETLKGSLVNTVTEAAVSNLDLTDAWQASTTITIGDLAPGSYHLDLLGTYNGNATYTGATDQKIDFTITAPTAVTFSTTKTDVLCYGESTGTITIRADGGVGHYQYSRNNGTTWTNFANATSTTTTIQNLPAGSYSIKVRDGNGCVAKEGGNEKTVNIAINQPAAPLAFSETEVREPSGYGLSNGYISVIVKGGTATSSGTYSYQWTNSETSEVITQNITTQNYSDGYGIKLDQISAGKYHLLITDANGCKLEEDFEINQPDPLEVNISVQKAISCNGNNNEVYKSAVDTNGNGIFDRAEDGVLRATVQGGIGGYVYQWQKQNGANFENIAGADSPTLTNLTAGTYKVLIKDANNNQTEALYTLNFPPKLELKLSASELACYAMDNGEVSVTASGGTAPYSYKWNTSDTTPSVTGLTAGNYSVLVQDANVCTVQGSIAISQPAAPLAFSETEIHEPSGYGLSNGYISVIVKGGTATSSGVYFYQWTNSETSAVITQNITTQNYSDSYGIKLDQIPVGKYHLLITDANGCKLEEDFEINQPDPLEVSISVQKTISCNGNNNEVYKSAVDTNGNGIFDRAEDGVLRATVQGGVGGYVYQWQKQNGANFENIAGADSPTLTNLTAGTYKVLIKDANNNQTEAVYTLNFPPKLELKLSASELACYAMDNGEVSVTASGGTAPYSYKWNTSDTTPSVTGLTAGNYSVLVQDANVCTVQGSIAISQPAAPLAFSETEVHEPSGYGLSNGYISVIVKGGTATSSGAYFYQWTNTQTGSVITQNITTQNYSNGYGIKLDQIPSGKYHLLITDANGCKVEEDFEVNDPLEVSISVQKAISCNGNNNEVYKSAVDTNGNGIFDRAEDGVLRATVRGGVGGYVYQWQKQNGANFENIAGSTFPTLTNLTAGTYKVLIKDAYNNQTEAVYTLNFPRLLELKLSANTLACNAMNDGEASVTASGGTAPYTYKWNTSDTTPSVTGLTAGNYFVLVQDANVCTVQGNITINQPGGLEINDISVKNPTCSGSSDGAIQVEASGGKTPYDIVWSNGMTGTSISGLKAGSYTVYFTDANGCTAVKRYTLTNPAPLIIDLGKDVVTLCQGDTQTYDVKIADPNASYKWTDGNGNIIGSNSSITLSQEGTYTVVVTDSKGCTGTDQVVIKNSMAVLSPEFMLATHAYVDYTVELVNTSPREPESVEWILPETSDIQVVFRSDDYLELKFLKTGTYRIGLKGTQGTCEKIFYKDIIVEENTTGVELQPTTMSNIKEFTIAPNPNNGTYRVIVKLSNEAEIKLRIMDFVGHELLSPVTEPKAKEFEVLFQNSGLSAGTYLIILETSRETRVKKMLVY